MDATTSERSGVIEREGRRLAWRSIGSGPALLLINGYAATGGDWDPQLLAALARSFEVICPDNCGVGGSQLPTGPLAQADGKSGLDGGAPNGGGLLTVDSMAADMEALLDSLGIERVPIVVGWSMGGFVAQRLAARAPRRVGRLTLLATDPGGAAAVPTEMHAWGQLTDHSGTPRERASRMISVLFPIEVAAQIDRELGEQVAAAQAQLSPRALSAQEAAMAAWHAAEQPLPAVDAPPVLIAHGSADVIIPPQNAAALAAHWPDCGVEIFAGGGHAFMAQEPQRLADLITSFSAE